MPQSVVLLVRKKSSGVQKRKRELERKPVIDSHFHRIIKKLPGGPYYTVAEVAFLIERHQKTIKRWHREGARDADGLLRPSKKTVIHGERIQLWTDDDVDRYRAYAESL
jgi:hypothetical protein